MKLSILTKGLRLKALLLAGFLLASVMVVSTPPVKADHIREGDARFKVVCNYSHSLNDDPIVYPEEPGASHLHDFAGNQQIDAYMTTYSELTTGTTTTCTDALDLAGYWVPALYTADGKIDPKNIVVYYRRGNKHGTIEPFPPGLKIIAGHGGSPLAEYGWKCSGTQPPQQTPPTSCPDGQYLNMTIRFPDCWDGVNRNSGSHRAHMEYSTYDAAATANVCPGTHPVQVPAMQFYVNFPNLPDGSTVTGLASGGTDTVHADFFNGWDRTRLQELVDNCLNTPTRCEA